MGDVADIVGLSKEPETANEITKIMGQSDSKLKQIKPIAKKPKGMSREVYELLGQDSLLSTTQTPLSSSFAFKSKRSNISKSGWTWTKVFDQKSHVSLRTKPNIYHWSKSELVNCEYPYLKFDVSIDHITYSDEEYEAVLKDENWSHSETGYLMNICRQYDLRWPIIFDRYDYQPLRRPEEIQYRYYTIASKLTAYRNGSDIHKVAEVTCDYNIDVEKHRRIHQELLFHKTRQEVLEEASLKDELKQLDASIKKAKKALKAQDKESRATSSSTTTTTNNATTGGFSYTPDLHPTFPMVGKPALQSSRLISPEYTTTISKTLLKKLNSLLHEYGIPETLLPTKAVCDLYDNIRRHGVALLSLQTLIQKKEKEINTLKSHLQLEESKGQSSGLTSGQHGGSGSSHTHSNTLSDHTDHQTSSLSSNTNQGGGHAGTAATGGTTSTNPAAPKKQTQKRKKPATETPADTTSTPSAGGVIETKVTTTSSLETGGGDTAVTTNTTTKSNKKLKKA